MGILDYLMLQYHMRFASEKALRAWQTRKVRRLIALAGKKAPYYRERLEGIPFRHLEDLQRVPTINKQEMMTHFDDLNTCNLKLSELMPFAVEKERTRDFLGYWQNRFVIGLSSGTSGNKGLYVTPKSLTRRLPFVFLARGGVPLSLLPFRILFLLRVFSQGFSDLNAPMIHLSYLSTMTPVTKILETIRALRINVLMAPPSLVRLLLPWADQLTPQVKRIVCYAEVLEKEEKERFVRTFQCPVVEIYQASEGQIGSSCRCGRLHINEDLVLVELLDSTGRPVTQPGIVADRMLVTNLVNKAQPLIRYEMNDLVVLDEPCPCGSRFRTIRQVLGRRDDVLWLADSEGGLHHVFPDLVSRWIITTSDDIREFRVTQEEPDHLVVEVDPLPLSGDEDAAWAQLCSQLQTHMQEGFSEFGVCPRLKFVRCSLPQPEDRSKYKRFVRLTREP